MLAFTKLRIIALALCPVDKLTDSDWLVRQGLLGPQAVQIKAESTKKTKILGPDGKKLEHPRFRVLKIQTFEDGLLARVLTAAQCEAEKDSLRSPHNPATSPVLVGSGHVGVGAEVFWRHLDRCADPLSTLLETCSALGDDTSAGNKGVVTSLDYSAFDETASIQRFDSVSVACVVGATHTEPNPLYASAVIGYHRALAHQMQLVAGYLVPGRSAWPSAVPHTSFGDSVPAAAAGIALLLSDDPDVDFQRHDVLIKEGSRKDGRLGEQGAEALSCSWAYKDGKRTRKFLNYERLKHNLAYDFSEDKALVLCRFDRGRRQRRLPPDLEQAERVAPEYKGISDKVRNAGEAQLASAFSLLSW